MHPVRFKGVTDMRDAYFRAKRKSVDEWIYGGLLRNDGPRIFTEAMNNSFRVREETICRYSGICDVNNRQIFENDVMMIDGKMLIIAYRKVKDKFVASDGRHIYENVDLSNGMIIGNTIDNPELRKRGKAGFTI